MSTDHLFLDAIKDEIFCAACGDFESLSFNQPMDYLIQRHKEFKNKHKKCKGKKLKFLRENKDE